MRTLKQNIIVVKNVTKSFRDNVALRDISVQFEQNKIHGVVGRNGSGKTVLFKCICGLMHQDSGEILVQGKRVGQEVDIPSGIGAIIEAPGFLPNYSGLQNLRFLASIQRKVGTEKIKETLRIVGLDPESKKHVGKYSLGMRQRLGLAQAIMEDPKILILDEPMNGLDNDGVQNMRTLLLDLKNKGVTILLASHSKEDIELLCDTVIEMDKGRIIHMRNNEPARSRVSDFSDNSQSSAGEKPS